LYDDDRPHSEVVGQGYFAGVAVTENDVFYNACAGGTLVRVDLETFKRVQFIDERPSLLRSLPHLRSGVSNLVEAFSRANVIGNSHLLLKALRATRFSLLDDPRLGFHHTTISTATVGA